MWEEQKEEMDIDICLMIGNTIEEMMRKIEDSPISMLQFHFSNKVVIQINTLIG